MFVSGQRDSTSIMPIQAVKISLCMAKDTSLLDFFFFISIFTGFFICLTFVAKKRTVALLRGAMKKHHDGGHGTHTTNTFDTKL